MSVGFWWELMNEEVHLKDLSIDGDVSIKIYLNE
jgi:hypothetical protein